MEITQTTFVREILMVRPAQTAPWAFHQKKITITSGAAVPIPDVYGDAQPLSLADLDDALDPIFVDMTNERDAAVAGKAASDAALTSMTADRDAKANAVTNLTIERDAAVAGKGAAEVQVLVMTSARDSAIGDLATMTAERDALRAQLDALTAEPVAE